TNVLFFPLHPPAWNQYVQHVLLFPLNTALLVFPASAMAIYGFVRSRKTNATIAISDIAVWTVLINLIPYWLAPGSQRYLLPLVPLSALIFAQVIVQSGSRVTGLTAKVLVANIVVALIASLAAIPLYQRYVRGNYEELSSMILARTGEEPLYATDLTAVGSSLVAILNEKRAPRAPIN